MNSSKKSFTICIPIFDGVDLLDVTGPYEILSWFAKNYTGEQQFSVYLLAKNMEAVRSANGVQLIPHQTFSQIKEMNLLLVPGASPEAMNRQMLDQEFTGYLNIWAKQVSYLCSVCVGSLLLANAGLLDNYWAYLPCFVERFDKVKIAIGYPRFVVDDSEPNGPVRVTGGGISSGLDLSLQLLVMLADEKVAKHAQAAIQYFPEPPVKADLAKVIQKLKQERKYCCPL